MKTNRLIGVATIVLLAITLAQSISFYEPVQIGDINNANLTQIRKSGGIRCSWNASNDTENTTVYWYKNGGLYDTKPVLVEYDDILPALLTEEDIWNCTVRITNSTGHNTNLSAEIEIIYDPNVYINLGSGYVQIIKNASIYEDTSYNVKWNTTADDAISFDVTEGVCTGGGVGEGTGTCSPDSSHLGSNLNTSNNQLVYFEYDYASSTQRNSINFTVIPVNDPPSYSAPNQSMEENEVWDGASATITVSDEEGNFPINFTAQVPGFCSYGNTSNTIYFNCSPTPLNIGNFTINITAIDNPPYNETYPLIPQSLNRSFVLEVTAVNHNPNITYVSNSSGVQNENYTIIINATDNFDNNTLNFSINSSCSLPNPWTGVISTTNVTWDGQNYTSYGTGIWNRTLNNSHIVCRNITITVIDGRGESNTTTKYLNISNVNDPPTVHNYSANSGNTLNNKYIFNLTAYENAPFVYQINATDPDLLVTFDENFDNFSEALLYLSNDTWLNTYLDNSTGLINITGDNMNLTPGNYSFLINVSDNGTTSLSDTELLSMEVIPNNPPSFNQTLNFTCYEYDSLNYAVTCNINITPYTNASDPGDSITNYTDNSNIFNISRNGSFIFNASQAMVGDHAFNVTITDSKGATNTTIMYLYINNTNNRPNITNIESREPPTGLYYNSSSNNLAQITVSDLDLQLNSSDPASRNYNYERLNLTWVNNNATENITGYISIVPNLTNDTSSVYLIINTTKLFGGELMPTGTYSINVTAQDNYANHTGNTTTQDTDTYTYNFTVYNVSGPPVITNVYPYGAPQASETTFAWMNATDEISTNLNLSENRTIFFNQTTNDENISELKYNWYYDGSKLNLTTTLNHNTTAELEDSNKSINITFGFYEARTSEIGLHNLTLVVIDGFDKTLNDTFTWELNLTDVNRPIVLNEPIPNITVVGSRNVDNKDLWSASSDYGFYDPDYDYDADGTIELTESNFTITYSVSDATCGGFATINVSNPYSYILDGSTNMTWIQGHGMTVTALANGSCNVTFTGSDGEFNATSNYVFMNITATSGQSQNVINVVEGSSGGTRTVTELIEIPLPEEVEKPIPIDIVLPDMVTVYENNTIDIPLTVTNTWNSTVYGVHLDYEIQNDSLNYSVTFERQHFFQIDPGEEIKTFMTVSGYRVGGVYEILIIANVTDPEYQDTAKVYLNSIEQSTAGSQVKTLIAFARDLLQKNKECQELGEILNQAEERAEVKDIIKALELVNSVINGCKYLISQEQKWQERPGRFRNIYIPLKSQYLIYLAVGLTIIIIGGGTIGTITRRKRSS